MKRISVIQAGAKLGVSPGFIKKQMLAGKLPIGKCIKNEVRTTYIIYEEYLEEYLRVQTS